MDRQPDDEATGFNRRRRSSDEDHHEIYQNNRPINRRRINGTNGVSDGVSDGVAGEVQNGDDELFLSLSLRSGPPPSMTSSHPPPMASPTFFKTSSPSTTTTTTEAAETQPPSSMTSSSPPLRFLLHSPPTRHGFRSVFMDPATNPAGEPRRNRTAPPAKKEKTPTVPPPHPWATNQRGRIHSIEYLESKQINSITGDVQCKHCEKQYKIRYDLREKFTEVEKFIEENKEMMRERAPATWMNPVAMTCEFCERERSVKPMISDRKRNINWLFLLLGKHLGYCTLEQLKYFCKHSNNHRTGAKDRVLYLTYLGLCKMLKPCELFDR